LKITIISIGNHVLTVARFGNIVVIKKRQSAAFNRTKRNINRNGTGMAKKVLSKEERIEQHSGRLYTTAEPEICVEFEMIAEEDGRSAASMIRKMVADKVDEGRAA